MTQESYIDTIIKEENIFPVYQPVVSLTKGDIFGYEALSSHNSSQSNSHEFLEHFHSGIPPIKNDFYFGKPLQLLRGLSR